MNTPTPNGNFSWLMRKDQCMHCADPGCLLACPADGAIVQYTNGIVDFQQDNCIGCQYCVTGCPFNIPKFNSDTKKVHKCTLCSDRVGAGLEPACIKACPTGCLHFGTKDDMKDLAETRVAQLHEHTSHKDAGVYDPPGVGGTHVIYVLHDINNPERYGGLPKDPQVPWMVRIWKGPLKWLGNLAMAAGIIGVAAHYIRFGPKEVRRNRRNPRNERHGSRSTHPARRRDRALHIHRAHDALAHGPHVSLLPGDRPGLLFTASVLDRVCAGRRPHVAILASHRRRSCS